MKTEKELLEIVEALKLELNCDTAELKSYLQIKKTLMSKEDFVTKYKISHNDEFTFSIEEIQELISFIEDTLRVLTLSEYIKLSPRTLNNLKTQFDDEMHMVLGITSESGELADAYKKHFAYNTTLDRTNISEEFGDMMWYTSNWFKITGMSIFNSLWSNIAKLKARYPDGFSEDKAVNRDLKAEREILEKGV